MKILLSWALIIEYWILIQAVGRFSRKPRPPALSCLSAEKRTDDQFDPKKHEEEVGFLRDVLVRLAIEIHQKFGLEEATKPCNDLAQIKVFNNVFGWRNPILIEHEFGMKTFGVVKTKSLEMLEDFKQEHFIKQFKLLSEGDQIYLLRWIDAAITLLSFPSTNRGDMFLKITVSLNGLIKAYAVDTNDSPSPLERSIGTDSAVLKKFKEEKDEKKFKDDVKLLFGVGASEDAVMAKNDKMVVENKETPNSLITA